MQDAGTKRIQTKDKAKALPNSLQVCIKLRALLVSIVAWRSMYMYVHAYLRQLKLGFMKGIRNRGSRDGVGRILKHHLSTKVTGQPN